MRLSIVEFAFSLATSLIHQHPIPMSLVVRERSSITVLILILYEAFATCVAFGVHLTFILANLVIAIDELLLAYTERFQTRD